MDISFVPFFMLSLIYLLFSITSLLLTSTNSYYKNSCECCYDLWSTLLGDSLLKLICSFLFLLFGYTGFRKFSNKSHSTDTNLIGVILLSLSTDIFILSMKNKCLNEYENKCDILWHLTKFNLGKMYFLKHHPSYFQFYQELFIK